jgi:uncharacterized membrane protein (Fun14 family)
MQILAILDEIFRFITSESIGGIPTFVVMILPFVCGLILGYIVRKFLKIAIIAGIIIAVAAYLCFFGLSLGPLKNLADLYGPV